MISLFRPGHFIDQIEYFEISPFFQTPFTIFNIPLSLCYSHIFIIYIFSEFETMINPQVKPSDGKKSLKSIKKFLPQLSSIAKKEGLSVKDDKPKGPIKVDTVISAFKDEKISIKL